MPRFASLSWRLAPALLLAACATPLERPLAGFTSSVIEVAPGAPYEKCVPLQTGERLLFSYQVDPPMSFAIRRKSGTATLSYLLRDGAREESGIFFVPESETYCLHWDSAAGDTPWPTLLRFTIQLKPAGDNP